jgi:signal transduction histidine kinase/CheY-like chemotaxis protein/HPt (histidine-containing phosphotransfer) domain-containing protein
MKKASLPVKVGLLLTLGILLISIAGYLTFHSLSSIVASIQVNSRPDFKLLAISGIAADLDKAESSVRIYTHTRKQQDIKPYYSIIANIDDKVNILRVASSDDSTLLAQIDTISGLIEEDIVIWNGLLDLYHTDSLDIFIRKLAAKVAVGALNKKNSDMSILKRVFSRKTEIEVDQQEIISDLYKIEKQDSINNTHILATESQLAVTGNEIRARFYILISKMENEVINSINSNAKAADRLAIKTYRWLALVALTVTLLVILVLIVVVRYVRKTHEYQIALEKSKEETENLARTKELFIANMSHEIRTPVNAIYGFAEQLLYEPTDEKSRKILNIIKSSADHLVLLVNDILDFSKLQNAKIVLEKTHFQIRPVCEEVLLLFEKRASESNTRLLYSISKTTPLVLLGDSHRLKQILFNLVGNAVKFTANGEIHFMVDCEIKSDDSLNLILKVTDTGIGISEEMQNRVFDDFTQAESDTSRRYGGTGLGLSIVKKLVELHQGNIVLKSQKNKGTAITCIMPYSIGKWEQLHSLTASLHIPERIKGLNILIVDDEEYNRLLFKTILDRWNVYYDEASDGLMAIDLIKTTRYDMVFMDLRMPGLDGLKSTSHIRKELKKSQDELPVIGISATHAPEDMKKYKLSGMNTFLSKPFTEKMLLDVILSILEPTTVKPVIRDEKVGEISPTGNNTVNLSNLYHLADNDIPFVKQMLIRFIESTEQGLQEIHNAVETGDVNAAMETAHKIASPCRHIGADVLYSHLKAIETQVRNHKNKAVLEKLSEDSKREFSEIKNILQKHIGEN